MKIPFALFVLILAIGASLSWRDSARLAVVRENHTRLVAQASALGIFPEPPPRTDSSRVSRHGRETEKVTATEVLAEFTAFVKEMATSGKSLDSLDEANGKRLEEMLARVSSLDPAQMKALVVQACAAEDLKDGPRDHLLDHLLTQLAADHPQTALALFAELPDLLKNSLEQKASLVSSSLDKWAKSDPMAAIEWVRKNAEKFPEQVRASAKHGVIAGIASHDPKLAFKAYAELDCGSDGFVLHDLVSAAKTPEGRTATLSAIRDYLASSPKKEGPQYFMQGFTEGLVRQGFTSATQWVAGANLTPTELEGITESLKHYIKRRETGQWVEWVGKQLPMSKSEAPIREMVEVWTQRDYPAAGKWLASTPASPAKNTAIRSYAETVATLDPATATQWAMTLPPGPDRDATLKHIQAHPPTK